MSRKTPTAEMLRAQLEDLKKKLAVTEAAEKKAKEEAIRVRRGQHLTLLGLALADLLALSPEEKRPAWAEKARECFAERHAPAESATEKQKAKHEIDKNLLMEALDLAMAGQLR